MKYLALGAALATLAACTVPATGGQPMPKMTFAHLKPIPVSVYAVNVHKMDGKTEGDFIVDPMTLAEDYARSRFMATGGDGTLEVIIEEASVTKATEESPNNVARLFNVGSMDKYDVVVRMRLEHIASGGNVAYGKTLSARRLLSITEHASVAEREKHEIEGLEKMFSELDKAVHQTVTEGMRIASPTGSY